MRVLVTGCHGYIGCLLVPMLRAHGHDVVGLDSYLFVGCDFAVLGPWDSDSPAVLARDVRDVEQKDLERIDAVIHLAGISNDPLGDLNPECTYDINHRATIRLARLAKRAGVARFLQSSSCSLYGAQGDNFIDEGGEWNPVTPYGVSKERVERDLSQLADDHFSPIFLRNATAYGVSPRLRGDLVVNNLVGYAFTTGEVLLKSDGSPWRPLVHVEDIARAFHALLEAPREKVHNEAFNIGSTQENYRVRELAAIVEDVVPDSRVKFSEGAGPDKRNYRVNCDKIRKVLPDFETQWTVRRGVEELYDAYNRHGLDLDEFLGSRYLRIKRVTELQAAGQLNASLRWTEAAE